MPRTVTQVYLQYRLPSTSRNFPTFVIIRRYRMSTNCLNQPSYRLMCQCWLPSLVGLASPERLVCDNYTTNRMAAQPIPSMPTPPHLLEAVKVEPMDPPALQLPNVPGLAQPPRGGKLQVPDLPAAPRVPIGAVRVPIAADVPQGQTVLDGVKVEPLEDPFPYVPHVPVPHAPDTQLDVDAEVSAGAGDNVPSELKMRKD
ncbi:hypothetical protein AAVH_25417 [Aphelenchoides avenae]|nr:hypothetical protein AAVH_25417 [Aphelenchus avenae]